MIAYYSYLPSKAVIVKHFKTMQYTQCLSFSVTVSSFSTGQAFACKCDGPRMVLSHAVSEGHVIPSLVCNRADTSVSTYRGLVSL